MEQSRLFYSIWNWFSPGSERGSRKKGDSVRAPAREAPAGWGATAHSSGHPISCGGFNPRSRTGSDILDNP